MRMSLVVFGLLAINCAGTPPVGQDQQITEQERTAWKKYRARQVGQVQEFQHRSGPCVAIRLKIGGEWVSWGEKLFGDGQDWAPVLRLPHILDLFPLARAQGAARTGSSEPNVVASAVIDVITGDMPTIVEWYTDDGNGPKMSKTAPTADLDRAGREVLVKLVKMAAR